MKYGLLNDPAVNDEERKFVENCQSGNPVHREEIAAKIYATAINRQSAERQITAAGRISESNDKQSNRMFWLTVALALATALQAFAALKSVNNESYANALNKVLTENSNRDLEASKKKLSFDIINTLYKDFYQFSATNSLVIRKLKAKEEVKQEDNLGIYLNGFEDLYEQCKRGLISRQDILMNFEYLIGPTCNNQQVLKVIGNHGNGLKILCHSFFSNTLLGNSAKIESDSCK